MEITALDLKSGGASLRTSALRKAIGCSTRGRSMIMSELSGNIFGPKGSTGSIASCLFTVMRGTWQESAARCLIFDRANCSIPGLDRSRADSPALDHRARAARDSRAGFAPAGDEDSIYPETSKPGSFFLHVNLKAARPTTRPSSFNWPFRASPWCCSCPTAALPRKITWSGTIRICAVIL